MNADLQGLWDAYFGKNKAFKNCNIIVTDKGQLAIEKFELAKERSKK